MDKAKAVLFASVMGIALFSPLQALRAQVRVDPAGSTIQGDILRGQGRFLEGAAWYELNDAKAAAINAETAKKIFDWNTQVHDAYMRERDAETNRRRSLTKAQLEDAKQRYAERQNRLKTGPTDDDIRNGDALNAMLTDLSNPSIAESSWRLAKVELPEDISIKKMVFRFAAMSGDRSSQALSQGVIALGRLDLEGHWPEYFPLEKLAPELRAYEAAFRKIRDQCLAGRLTVEAVSELDRSIEALKKKVGTAVASERGYRAAAGQFVEDLKKATKMFDASTLGFAREMISDTQKHEAHTVGELLAFMRKYRLMFAGADKSPEAFALYGRLYDLMRKQADKLEIKPGQGLTVQAKQPDDKFQVGSVWIVENPRATLTVTGRNDGKFNAIFDSSTQSREVTGTITDGKIHWYGRDVRVIRGVQGSDNYGTIQDDVIPMEWSGNGMPGSGKFVLKLKKD